MGDLNQALNMKNSHNFMQIACLTGGFIFPVKNEQEALEAEKLGAVGMIISSDSKHFQTILNSISIHPIISGILSKEQIEILSNSTSPEEFYLPTNLQNTDISRSIIKVSNIEQIKDEAIENAGIIYTGEYDVFTKLCSKRKTHASFPLIFYTINGASNNLYPNLALADGFIFQQLPSKEVIKQYQQLFTEPVSPFIKNTSEYIIGIISIQGDYRVQANELKKAISKYTDNNNFQVRVQLVRTDIEVKDCDAIVLPGGWSNLQSAIYNASGLNSSLRNHHSASKPILAICAGMILAGAIPGKDCTNRDLLGFADITIENNVLDGAHSVTDIYGKTFISDFSNGPIAINLGKTATPLAWTDSGDYVVVRDQNVIVSACHSGEIVHDEFIKTYVKGMQRSQA